MVIPEDKQVKDRCEYLSGLAHSTLPFAQWGFQETFRTNQKEWARVIYDSDRCRIQLAWEGWDMAYGYMLSISYGRSHAPNDNVRMTWNGEECHCWHGLWGAGGEVLNFLDGLLPKDAAHRKTWPRFIDEFGLKNSRTISERKGKSQSEDMVDVHAAVWNHYGMRLFELFDLHRPDLWEQYRIYMKEVYDIKGRSLNIHPSLDKVC